MGSLVRFINMEELVCFRDNTNLYFHGKKLERFPKSERKPRPSPCTRIKEINLTVPITEACHCCV